MGVLTSTCRQAVVAVYVAVVFARLLIAVDFVTQKRVWRLEDVAQSLREDEEEEDRRTEC